MIELPEAIVLANQISSVITGKRITNVVAAQSPHKFAWYQGDPQKYHDLLSGKRITGACGVGSMVEIHAEDMIILFSEGVSIRYHQEQDTRPQKHQLLIELDDLTAFSGSVQMYGGLMCFCDGESENKYYKIALDRPSPLSTQFDHSYFHNILSDSSVQKMSIKALLATEQRIPGLGNGVLQDILFKAKIHPKKKTSALFGNEKEDLFISIKETLAEMVFKGGRDTEKDIFGCSGGYVTFLSKKSADKPCRVCGGVIIKENYLGGSIYYCKDCQKI